MDCVISKHRNNMPPPSKLRLSLLLFETFCVCVFDVVVVVVSVSSVGFGVIGVVFAVVIAGFWVVVAVFIFVADGCVASVMAGAVETAGDVVGLYRRC